MTVISIDKPFTTFEVAKICGVFHTTVINWVNKGKLKAYHTPGGHRRILLADLLELMRRYDMPIPSDLTQRAKKVLIVEDDPAMQRVLSRAAHSLGQCEISTCAGGLEALMSIGKEAPDLLVLDIRIPQVNGLEVLKLLRSNDHTRQIRIIAVSGEALAADEEGFLKAHADSFLRKPLSPKEFKQKAAELLDIAPAGEARR